MTDGGGGDNSRGGGDNGFSGELSPASGRPAPPDHPNAGFAPPPPMMAPAPVMWSPSSTYGMKKHPLATVSLACGVAAFPLSCCCSFLSFPLPIVAIVCGAVGLAKIRKNPEMFGGRNEAMAGIVLGAIGVLVYAGVIVLQLTPELMQKLKLP